MPRTIKVTLEDTPKLATLVETMKQAAIEALMRQAHLIVGLAQVYVPVDTGSLRDSIRVERGGEGLYWAEVRIRAGGYIVNPKTKRLVDYAVFVEAKQPFLAPAVLEVQDSIADVINRFMVDATNE